MKIIFFKEDNNFYIIPSIRLYWDKGKNDKLVELYIEFVWMNGSIGVTLIKEK